MAQTFPINHTNLSISGSKYILSYFYDHWLLERQWKVETLKTFTNQTFVLAGKKLKVEPYSETPFMWVRGSLVLFSSAPNMYI